MKNNFNDINAENPDKKKIFGFFGTGHNGDDFGLDYAESLAEGDLRPFILEDYEKEKENELF